MCGIVGYVGHRDAASILIPALRRLEYRGYDSAGLATVASSLSLDVRKAPGKIESLAAEIASQPPQGSVGIAHTRWATHGRPSAANAHPHVDCQSRVAIVHNGIIENYRELRRRLAEKGHLFQSETDTEVIAHLIEHYRTNGLAAAVRRAADDLQGSYALACIGVDSPDTLVAIRRGSSPLVLGYGDGEAMLASDIPALLGRARQMVVLDDGEMAIVTGGRIRIVGLDGSDTERVPMEIPWDGETAERSGYPHFMLKEIFEQPEAVRNTWCDRVDPKSGDVRLSDLGLTDWDLTRINRLMFIACGSSYHAALVGKYLIESLARVPVDVDIASEFRYRKPVLDGRVLTVPISQSGETADTLAAARHARTRGSRVVAICNVVGSSLAREADGVFYTRAGIEIGVASTKAFTAQLVAVLMLAVKLGRARKTLDEEQAMRLIRDLQSAPSLLRDALTLNDEIAALAAELADRSGFLYLGRGIHYPMALEGALKLKEITYSFAEGYAAGEMKHGPIALIDRGTPVVAIATAGPTYEKMASNIEEVKAREATVVAIATKGDEAIKSQADYTIFIPPASQWIQPLLSAIPLQLLAYHVAVKRGCDVDQPRNLAKSVTVE